MSQGLKNSDMTYVSYVIFLFVPLLFYTEGFCKNHPKKKKIQKRKNK